MTSRTLPLVLLLGIAAAPAPAQEPPRAEPSLTRFLEDPVLHALYAKPGWGRLDPKKLDPSGAYGGNLADAEGRSRKVFMDEQRYGVDSIEAGIATRDPRAIREAFKLFDWGFAQAGPDGGFAHTADAFHSTGFFIEAVARSLVLLKETGDPEWREPVARYAPKVLAAAKWLSEPRVAAEGRKGDRPYVHRRWNMAAALGLAAELSGDAHLRGEAAKYAEEGIREQDASGFNPERGGYDVNYNAVGIAYAETYLTTLRSPRDSDLAGRVRRMIATSLRWEATKVTASGDVDISGSTRVGHEKNRMGEPKTTGYGPICRAFALGAAITGEREFRDLAERIADFRWHIGKVR
jgi:hypothetical protein